MYNEYDFDKFVELCNDQEHNQSPLKWGEYRKLLKRTNDKTIIEKLGMHDMSRIIYVLQKKHRRKAFTVDLGSDWEIRCKRTVIGRASYQAVTIHFIKIENNQLIIEGESSIPSCFKEEAAVVYISANSNMIKADFSGYNADKRIFHNVYEYCRAFKAVVPLSGKSMEIKFAFKIDKKLIFYRAINVQRFSPVADIIPFQYSFQEGYIIQINGNILNIIPGHDREVYEKQYSEHISEEIAELRKEAFEFLKNKKRPIWLFADRLNYADDNAYCLFRYVNDNKISVDSYFIVNPSAPQYDEIKRYGNTVTPFSREHLFLYLVCDSVISSQCNGIIENPFMDKCEEVRDLYHNHKIVFLQHGVIKDDMSITLNRFNTGIDVFITSAYKEWQSIVNGNYGYNENQVWVTGLPRFDYLSPEESKLILIMPTWRKELMENIWDESNKDYVWIPKKNFYTSKYYSCWTRFLKCRFLKYIYDKTGYKFVFVPHPLIKSFFRADESEYMRNIDTYSYRELYSKAALLITDYSSAVFDGVYLNKPVIYYQFDQKNFYRNHTYRKGYFDYVKDGFGPVCKTRLFLYIIMLCQVFNLRCIKNKYDKRISSFLTFRDDNNCERICNKLLDL